MSLHPTAPAGVSGKAAPAPATIVHVSGDFPDSWNPGKTPVVRELLRRLRDRQVEAHGLSRGYGGRLEGPVLVDPAIHTAAEVGDEPLMLGADGPIWVSRDRAKGALVKENERRIEEFVRQCRQFEDQRAFAEGVLD